MAIDPTLKYQQLCEDFRQLNTVLWQIPPVMITLTGGLWFAAATVDLTDIGRSALLYFGGAINILLIAALIRLRLVMHSIKVELSLLDTSNPPGKVFWIVSIFSILLLVSAVGSFWAASKPGTFVVAQRAEIVHKLEISN